MQPRGLQDEKRRCDEKKKSRESSWRHCSARRPRRLLSLRKGGNRCEARENKHKTWRRCRISLRPSGRRPPDRRLGPGGASCSSPPCSLSSAALLTDAETTSVCAFIDPERRRTLHSPADGADRTASVRSSSSVTIRRLALSNTERMTMESS